MPLFPVSLAIPDAPAFPRGPFAPVLARHARSIDASLDSFVDLLQDFAEGDDALATANQVAVRVFRDARGEVVSGMRSRGNVAREVPLLHGIQRVLRVQPEARCLYVVVELGGIASLQLLRARKPAPGEDRIAPVLEVAERDVVVEPLAQEHRECGAWTVTRWAAPDGAVHWGWVPTPSAPTSQAETVDRLLARHEAFVRRRLWDARGRHDIRDPLVLLLSSGNEGESVTVIERDPGANLPFTLLTDQTPTISRLLQSERRPGLVPIYVRLGDFAGLRWLDLQADRAGAPDAPTLTEDLKRRPPVAVPDELVDDIGPPLEPDDATPAQPLRPRTDAEVFAIIETEVLWDEMERLVTLTDAELDEAVRDAGFDPGVERATPRSLRNEVVEAIADLTTEVDD
jgi:hypothetical protein